MAFVQAIVEAYRQRGMDPAEALRKAQIEPHTLTQPQGRITALQMEWISEAAMRELDDEALGAMPLLGGDEKAGKFAQVVPVRRVQACEKGQGCFGRLPVGLGDGQAGGAASAQTVEQEAQHRRIAGEEKGIMPKGRMG